ncbi:MAG: hypothetical protein J7J30_03985, partial [Candidatus Odinarchaeota archaeon]|nr:hypothetical protein [Candidatus Odinarchaeota archaeon]
YVNKTSKQWYAKPQVLILNIFHPSHSKYAVISKPNINAKTSTDTVIEKLTLKRNLCKSLSAL